MKNRRWLLWFCCMMWGAIAALILSFGPFSSGAIAADTATLLDVPLSTQAAQIVGRQGKPILLRGVNWFGIETETHAPHGLWARDYKDMLAQIKDLGYNLIRLPFSLESLQSSEVSGIDYSIGSNADFEGKTPFEVMDIVIEEAERQGLLILLDFHQLNDEYIPQLWYDEDYSEADWLKTWQMLAWHYQNHANVIGADLKNEPHGAASWGTNDMETDWRLAAERAGNLVLSISPHWLIVVQGVENNVPNQQLAIHWQGGNLEGVTNYPVRLSNPRQLVYSPHEYGPGVFDQPWFSDPAFPENLSDRWQTGFQYIADNNIAPILIGEFGGRRVDAASPEGIWQRKLVDFIHQNELSYAYWSWNPNSADTGGILLDDWQQIDADKQALLDSTLR